MASLWRVDPGSLPRPSKTKRKVDRGPLIDLKGLQAAIQSKVLKDDAVEFATASSEKEMQNLSWEASDLLDCIASLEPGDFRNAEWCEDGYGTWYACDAYAIKYDHIRRCRVRRSDINYYLKFSIEEDGSLLLIVIRIHL